MERCDTGLSGFASGDGLALGANGAKVLWFVTDHSTAIGEIDSGCVANGGAAVCACNGAFNADRLMSLNPANGSVLFDLPDLSSSAVTLPLLDYTGGTIGWDSHSIARCEGTGIVDWAVPLLPAPAGRVFSPMMSDSGVIMLLSDDGGVTGMYANGVPDAHVTLNVTRSGVQGSWIPLGMPSGVGTVAYAATRWLPDSGDAPYPYVGSLVAIQTSGAIGGRLQPVWNLEYNLHPLSFNNTAFTIPLVAADGALIVLAAASSDLYQFSVLIIEDKTDRGVIRSRIDLSWSDTLSGQIVQDAVLDHAFTGSTSGKETSLWLTFADSSALVRIDVIAGKVVSTIDLNHQFGTALQGAQAMSRALAFSMQNSTANVFGLVFVCRLPSGQPHLVALQLPTDIPATTAPQYLWSVPLPELGNSPQYAIWGQIAAATLPAPSNYGMLLLLPSSVGLYGIGVSL
ncbi:hypothetical protein CAOG_003257 [Capsaspora owczarzaki ATCC 30864]|uniref:Uncharacterized protein n=2 Tax=Capsaspora owczarzaki (strain ATCC 30864) TaxID=595528 RepID=A0A0D2VP95_CAPO3|nr:hypothetical protein CAOG_003257 [Capsaspora owczarzaki ATCC 30864]